MQRKALIFFLYIFTPVFFVFFLFNAKIVFASSTDGTIDSTNKYARILFDGSNINFGLSSGNVHVTDSTLTGYAWSENVGWINLSPTYGGVTNNSEGTLSGYAWGELAGWINFAPTNGGVTIDSNGNFAGYAWSQNYGWIIFNCSTNSTCSGNDFKVSTDWRPASSRATTPTVPQGNGSPGGGGAGGGTGPGGEVGNPPPTEQPPSAENPPSSPPPISPEVSPAPDLPPPIEPQTPPVTSENSEPNSPSDSPNSENSFLSALPPSIADPIRFVGNQIIESYAATAKTLEQAKVAIRVVIESSAGSVVSKTVTVGGISASTVAGLSVLFTNPLSVSEIVLIPFRLWSLLLIVFGLKKRHRPWGTVYDSITKQPLDPAYVTLLDAGGKEIKSSITDLDGRYGFLSSSGEYKVRVGKTNYHFPSTKMAGKTGDELYTNLYFGESIAIKETGDVITKNIPMDPEGFDWNEFAKRKKKLTKFYSIRDVWVARISNILFSTGFIVSILALFSAPAPYNMIIFGLYVIMAILRKVGFKLKVFGLLEERATGLPLSFAIVRVSSPGLGQITKIVSDAFGRYYCLVPPGLYNVTVEKKNDDESYTPVFTAYAMDVSKGIINKNLSI